MAKFIYNCEDSSFSIEVDDNGRSYVLKGPVSQKGKIVNNHLSLTVNTKLFCCSDFFGVTLFLVDNTGQYEVFEFNHQGQSIHRFAPRCGKFGSQNNTCAGCPAFITLTCCDIQGEGGMSLGSDLDKEVYVIMKENDILKLYVYFSNGLSNVATPTVLQSVFGSSNALEFVDINCCGDHLQIIVKDLVIQEYVSAAVLVVPLPLTITLGLFDDDLPISSNFVRSFCCQGKYFVIFEVNGQNRVYQSNDTNQLGYTGTDEATTNNPFFDLDGASSVEYLLLGAVGEKFMSMICCDINGSSGDEVIAILKSPNGPYKIYVFSALGVSFGVNGAPFGVATDLFMSMTCCENTSQVFVTLKNVTGKLKLFGFNSQGGLVAGDFTNGLVLKEHTCNADLDLQEELVYVFRDDMDQNFLFITDLNGDAVLCPVPVGACGDIVQDIECCGFLKDNIGITTVQMILVILKDPTRDQLRLHAISVQYGPAFAPLDIGVPGDELVKLSCCDFVSQQITVSPGVIANNDIFVVLKNKYGLHKLEVYSSIGTEFFGHTCPKTLGMNGEEFFSLVCCNLSCDVKRLLLILRCEKHFSVYSFTDGTTKLLQETVRAPRVVYMDDSILFSYSNGDKNLLFILNQDGSPKLCPVTLQDGAVQFLGHCDIDNNNLEEIIVVIKESDGLNHVYIITETGSPVSMFGNVIGESTDEFVDFLCCDLNDDGCKELVFLLKNKETCCHRILAFNNYGERLFCRYVGGEGERFISMSCCPVMESHHECNDILLVMKHSSCRYMLYAYNHEGKRYHLDDLQYKTSHEEIVFKYTMGLDDYANPVIYRVNKKNCHEYCPKELPCHTMNNEGWVS